MGIVKKYYQICLTSHKDVMFRCQEDVGQFINCLALAAFSCDTEVVVDVELSTHVHLGVYSSEPRKFAGNLLQRYSTYLKRTYGRPYGASSQPYVSEIKGFRHATAFTTYALRNPVHHGVTSTPFAYKYSTTNHLFVDDMGREPERASKMTRQEMASFLPRRAEFPDEYMMDDDGVFIRRGFMQLPKCEAFYVTPRSYLYNMNMITDERWLSEQEKDATDESLITLETVEYGYGKPSLDEMLKNEKGFKYDKNRLLDSDVCSLIDKELLGRYSANSVYDLSSSQKYSIMRVLLNEFHLPPDQIKRCLAILD